MFAASDDSAMMKQIHATHAPDGRELDAKPLLNIVEDIFLRAAAMSSFVQQQVRNQYSFLDAVVPIIILSCMF